MFRGLGVVTFVAAFILTDFVLAIVALVTIRKVFPRRARIGAQPE